MSKNPIVCIATREGNVDTRPMRGVDYDGIDVSIKGFNLYYIFNHKRFSYPAAFSQSTIQRRSCGSALCGIGYTQHTLSIDWEKLNSLVADRLGKDVADKYMDTDLKMKKVKYTDIVNVVEAHAGYFVVGTSLAIEKIDTYLRTVERQVELILLVAVADMLKVECIAKEYPSPA